MKENFLVRQLGKHENIKRFLFVHKISIRVNEIIPYFSQNKSCLLYLLPNIG